jgi:hypothetical protein
MVKKQRKLKKTINLSKRELVYLGVLAVNFFSLYIHNPVLSWVYLFLVIPYAVLYEKLKTLPKPAEWLAIVYSPVLVSLYYLDFALSCATLLVLAIAHYYVVKERK